MQTKAKSKRDDLLSLREAAKILGVNRYWLSTHLKTLKVDLVYLGPSIGVWRSDLAKVEKPVAKKVKAS